MIKSIIFLFCCLCIISLCESATVYNKYVIPSLTKREDGCDISCTGELSNCAERCERSSVRKLVRELRVVCQDNQCYCGFEQRDDV
jgi:hypothetical protein